MTRPEPTAAMEPLQAAQQDCDRLREENADLRARLNAAGGAAARLSVLTLRAAQERDALLEAARATARFLAEHEGRDEVALGEIVFAALAAVAQADAP